ncbi:MAG: DUF4345 domain-containing protein [Acidimicrobiales bacterium]
MTPARIVLWLAGLSFIGFGMAFTLWPMPMGRLVEIPLPTPTARIDFAATYGGFELGVGTFLLACARRPAWHEAGLWAAAASLGGFALVRMLGLVVAAGPATRPIFFALALEITGSAIGVLALRHLRRTRAPTPAGS